MVLQLPGLVKRGGVWTYRKSIPQKLRPIVGAREIWRSLGTADETVALTRFRRVKQDVERVIAEAMAGETSPSVAAYKAMEGWTPEQEQRQESIDVPREMATDGKATPAQRAVLDSLVTGGDGDKPPVARASQTTIGKTALRMCSGRERR